MQHSPVPSIVLEFAEKDEEKLIFYDELCPGQDSNRLPSEYVRLVIAWTNIVLWISELCPGKAGMHIHSSLSFQKGDVLKIKSTKTIIFYTDLHNNYAVGVWSFFH